MGTDSRQSEARDLVAQASSGGMQTQRKTLADLLAKQEREIAKALPSGIDPARYARVVLTEVSKNPDLLKCTPQSFLGAVMTAAQLGLEFGPQLGHAYLIPYRSEATLVIGYKGWVKLLYQSGLVTEIDAAMVHEKDDFSWSKGLRPTLEHKPARGDRGPVTDYYVIVRTAMGGNLFAVMSKQEVVEHQKRYNLRGKGWSDNFNEMALKTVLLRIYRWLPVSTEQAAIASRVDERPVRKMTAEEDPEIVTEMIDAEVVDEEFDTPYDRGE